MGAPEGFIYIFSLIVFALALVLAALWIIVPFIIFSINAKAADQCRQLHKIIGLLEAQVRRPSPAAAPASGSDNPRARLSGAEVLSIVASSPDVRAR